MVPSAIKALDRPNSKLLTLYVLQAVFASLISLGMLLPFVLLGMLPQFIRYKTLRYTFDDEGVGISYGFFFRHESYLTYEKIQDIHLNRGLLERWLGLGSVAVQTASGSSGAEITLVGLTEFDAVRDYLYKRMRTGQDDDEDQPETPAAPGEEDALALLESIRDEVVALRQRLSPESA